MDWSPANMQLSLRSGRRRHHNSFGKECAIAVLRKAAGAVTLFGTNNRSISITCSISISISITLCWWQITWIQMGVSFVWCDTVSFTIESSIESRLLANYTGLIEDKFGLV